MKPIAFTMCLIAAMMLACGGPKKPAERPINRRILGQEMAFGKDAAKADLWHEAIFRWEKVVAADPNNSEATNNLAVAYESVGNFDQAEALYRKALELDEDNRDIRENYKKFLSFYKKHQRQIQREKAKESDKEEK